jgi:LmbE family N-acetylglucosaminyl deacetylase
MHTSGTNPEHALFLFPHQDDEYAAAPWIVQERKAGARVSCLYLTDGASKVPAAIRDAESLAVLASLGVPASEVAFLSDGERIGDGKLAEHAERGLRLVKAYCESNAPISRIYAPAWEGGHHDHDAAHVIALLLASARGLLASTWQFSSYHGYRPMPHPLFRVLAPLPNDSPRRTLRHGFADGVRYALLCRRYPSQLRTWVGLFPEAFLRRALLRREMITGCDPARVFSRPHPGTLLYERLFGARYEHVRARLAPLLERLTPSAYEARN